MGITIHGQQRIRERVEKVKDIDNLVMRAYTKGKTLDQFSGSLKKFLLKTKTKTAACNEIRVFGGSVYIFNEYQKCITVLQIPQNCKNDASRNKGWR